MKKILSTILFLFLLMNLSAQDFIAGNSYLDSTAYVEYIAGNLPIIISAPHGGYLEPISIPDRMCNGCTTVRDAYTQDLARELQAAIYQETGCYPHVIINLLHRKKFDANRDIGDAADGNSTVEQAWLAYHQFIDSAKAIVTDEYRRGVFFDVHGHGHTIQRIELGYLLSKNELQLTNNDLNTINYINESSIKTLVGENIKGQTHAELLRGQASFGAMLENRGYAAVPSDITPFPLTAEPYFSGGYNCNRHGSINGGSIDGIQIECNQSIRFTTTARQTFADSLAKVIVNYVDYNYNEEFEGNYCNLIASNTSIQEVKELKIYPNPIDNQLFIESDYKTLDLVIYNQIGQQVKIIKWSGSPIDMMDLESGLYFILVRYENKIIMSKKVIKG